MIIRQALALSALLLVGNAFADCTDGTNCACNNNGVWEQNATIKMIRWNNSSQIAFEVWHSDGNKSKTYIPFPGAGNSSALLYQVPLSMLMQAYAMGQPVSFWLRAQNSSGQCLIDNLTIGK